MGTCHTSSRRAAVAGFIACALLGSVAGLQAQPAQRIDADIDWLAAQQSIDDTAKNDLESISRFRASALDKGQTDNIALPVLIPKSGAVRASPDLRHQRSSYAASFALDKGASMTILGAASSLSLPDQSPLGLSVEKSAGQYLFEKTEDGADMNFTRFGASYVIRISCEDLEDKRCNAEDYLRTVADSLVAVGGRKP